MKRLFFAMTLVLAVVLTNCTKTEDDLNMDSGINSSIEKKKHTVAFKGHAEGLAVTQANGVIQIGPLVFVHKVFTGTGSISHFGNSTLTMDYWYVTISIAQNAPFNGFLLHQLIGNVEAANGDSIYFEGQVAGNTGLPSGFPLPFPYNEYDGLYNFEDYVEYPVEGSGIWLPTITRVQNTHCHIVKGTGRFEDAEGYLNGWGVQYLTPSLPIDYWYDIPSEFTCEGKILY